MRRWDSSGSPKPRSCRTLAEVGLGYLKLGQAGTTLSGGEAQRLKLVGARATAGRTHAVPFGRADDGLHFQDIARLVDVMFRLRDTGNTLIVIEHNLDVIKVADWIIDLGPDGGRRWAHSAEGTRRPLPAWRKVIRDATCAAS